MKRKKSTDLPSPKTGPAVTPPATRTPMATLASNALVAPKLVAAAA